MDHALVSASTIVWLGLAIGAAFGASSQRTSFCTMGAVSDAVNIGDWTRMRMWALAIALAILGTGALRASGLFDPARDDLHRRPPALAVACRGRTRLRHRHDAGLRLRRQDPVASAAATSSRWWSSSSSPSAPR